MSADSEKSREELLQDLAAARKRIAELEQHAQSFPVTLDGLLDSLADPIFIKDRLHRWIYFNQAFVDLTGLDPEKIIGHSDDEFFPPHEVAIFWEVDDRVLATGESQIVEEDVTVDGVTYRLRTVKSLWRDPRSGDELVLGVIHDITDRVRAEQRFQALFEHMRSGVAVYRAVQADPDTGTGPDYEILELNASGQRMENVRAEDVVGKRLTEVFPGVEKFGLLEVLHRVQKTGEPEALPLALYHDDRIAGWRENFVFMLPSGEIVAMYDDVTEQVEAIQALADSESRLIRERETFRVIFDGSLDAVFLTRKDASFFMVNHAAETLTGYTVEELHGMSIPDLHDDTNMQAFNIFFERIMSGEDMVTSSPLRRKDGSTVEVEFSNSRVRIGSEIFMHTVARDVSDRRRAEAELRASEEKHHALASATFEAIFISENGVCVETNEAASEMFGYSYDEIIGIFGTDVISEDTRHIVLANMLSGYEEPYEAVGVRKDGTHFPAQFQGRMFHYKGRPARVTAVRDLTEQKRVEQEVAESERKYRLLAENIEDVIFLTDGHLGFTYVSPGVVRLLGMTADEVLRLTLDQALTPESMGRVLEARERRKRAEAAGNTDLVNRLELEMFCKDGSTVWVEVIARGLCDDAGHVTGLVGLARNIDDRKRMEGQLLAAKEAAETASKAKSEFLANVSHEIRTPLNGMLGMLQLLQGGPIDAENAEMIDTSLECGRGLVALLNDILDLSQIEAGVVQLHPREFDLSKTLGSVLTVFEHQANARGLALTCDLGQSVPSLLFGDEGRLRQVLFNLLGNAMKFTDSGEVGVDVHRLQHFRADGKVQLLFRVYDTGIGIPEDRLGDVFENFTQVDGSYTRRYSGAGLGLAIVRRLVRLMGGGLVIDSEEGHGTEIYLSLLFDVVQPNERVKTDVHPLVAAACSGRMRVLLAEDDRVGRIAVQRMVERLGYECTGVECGADAVGELLRGGYHCALLDIQMPDMSGLEAVRIVRERLPRGASLPVLVALTAHAMHGDRETFLAGGMDAYLAKPVSMEELRELLESICSFPQHAN